MIFSNLLRLLLKDTKVTTGHQKWYKMGQNIIIRGQHKATEGARNKLSVVMGGLLEIS